MVKLNSEEIKSSITIIMDYYDKDKDKKLNKA